MPVTDKDRELALKIMKPSWHESIFEDLDSWEEGDLCTIQRDNLADLLAAHRENQWQDISTAPYGLWILIYAYGVVSQACWNANGWWETFNKNQIMPDAATHWMPLPTPPTEKGQ